MESTIFKLRLKFWEYKLASDSINSGSDSINSGSESINFLQLSLKSHPLYVLLLICILWTLDLFKAFDFKETLMEAKDWRLKIGG